jgi:hypothetical protein
MRSKARAAMYLKPRYRDSLWRTPHCGSDLYNMLAGEVPLGHVTIVSGRPAPSDMPFGGGRSRLKDVSHTYFSLLLIVAK